MSGDGKKVLGVKFAPVSIPLHRRLETGAVLYWISTYLFSGIATTILLGYLLFYSNYWWMAVLYLTWMIYDLDTCNKGGKSGRYTRFVRGWSLWKHFVNYFPIKLVKTVDLDVSKSYLVGSHPHGVLCSGAFGCFGTEGAGFSKIFPGLTSKLFTLEGQFWIPGYREFFAGSGAVAVTKRSMEAVLRIPSGILSVLVVGGAPESLNNDPGQIKLVLKKRKGFVKMALRFGIDLVPSFSFGESFIYDQVPNPEGSWVRRIQDTLQHVVGFAPVLFIGRGIFQYNYGLLPNRKPITLVVGKPIPVAKVEEPSKEDIERLHQLYVDSLVDLYHQYNPVYGDPNVKLVIT